GRAPGARPSRAGPGERARHLPGSPRAERRGVRRARRARGAHPRVHFARARDAHIQTGDADLALQSLRDTPGAPERADRALADGALGWARALLAARRDLSTFERDGVAAVNGGSIQTRR